MGDIGKDTGGSGTADERGFSLNFLLPIAVQHRVGGPGARDIDLQGTVLDAADILLPDLELPGNVKARFEEVGGNACS